MDKTKRYMLRVALQMVAQNVYKLEQEDNGVIDIKTHYIVSKFNELITEPSVHMTEEGFLKLFGDDTEFEYVTDKDGDMEMQTRVNGVLFFALVR